MRWLMNYLRQTFCKHEFDKTEEFCNYAGEFRDQSGPKVSLLCRKCGYHRCFWRY